MNIDRPASGQLPALRALWHQAFGDDETFLDAFFRTGFSPDRCRCASVNGKLAAALYWFDARLDGTRLAYLYAIATDKAFRGQGLCHALMADTHLHLAAMGYGGTVLVPGEMSLFQFYAGMGYQSFGGIREFSCSSDGMPVPLRPISASEYALLRRTLLPPGGILQEKQTLSFLQTQADFYAGADFVLCAAKNGTALFVPELLGNTANAPGILASLGIKTGRFRTPGTDRPFAMYRPLSDAAAPTYFGLALD